MPFWPVSLIWDLCAIPKTCFPHQIKYKIVEWYVNAYVMVIYYHLFNYFLWLFCWFILHFLKYLLFPTIFICLGGSKNVEKYQTVNLHSENKKDQTSLLGKIKIFDLKWDSNDTLSDDSRPAAVLKTASLASVLNIPHSLVFTTLILLLRANA